MKRIQEQQVAEKTSPQKEEGGTSSLTLLYKILWPVIVGVAIIGGVHLYRHYDTVMHSSLILSSASDEAMESISEDTSVSQKTKPEAVSDAHFGKKAFDIARLTFLINRFHDARLALQTDGEVCLKTMKAIRGLLSEEELAHIPDIDHLTTVESIETLAKQFHALMSPEQEGGISHFFGAQLSHLVRVRKVEEAEANAMHSMPASFYDMVEKIEKIGEKSPLQEAWLMNAKVTKALDGGLSYLEDIFEERIIHSIGGERQNVS